jgi:CBS domain-containing protein
MRSVRQLLEAKESEIHSIGPDVPVIDAIRLMAEKRIGRKIVLQGRSSVDTLVSAIMTSDLITVGLGDTADHCMQVVTDRRIRHLPVLHDDEVIGVVSIGDLVKAVIEDQQVEIDQLQGYIVGRSR